MMLATDAVTTSSFDRRYPQHQLNILETRRNPSMEYFLNHSSTTIDEISDCDAQSDKSFSNTHIKKSNNGRSSRRKQAAPRSRLVRQCDECDFSSSIINEFKTHMKFEHGHSQLFLCEICRFYTSSSLDYQLHLNSHQTNHSSSKFHISSTDQPADSDGEIDDDDSINIYSKGTNPILFENDEGMSDDDQNHSTNTNKKLNQSVTSSHSTTSTPVIPDRKRPYNVSVDPARYRRVPDPDDPSAVKFACSLCGNLYKWRKSLNKHWKEKHNDESPPPLDAPVTIRPPKSSTTTTTTITATTPAKGSNRTSEMIPQTSTLPHHPAFPFNPYAWLNFASQQMLSSFDQSSNMPLDLTMKSTKSTSSSSPPPLPPAPSNPMKKFHRDSNSSNDEQRDSSHHNPHDSDDDGHSEHASSSSPPNPYGQKVFICSICDQRFLAVEMINEHFLKNHLTELENEISGKSPPRNTNVAQQNEEWNLSDPVNPLKCIQCDFIGRWPTELQKHAASHSTSRPFKCLVCSLTYKWRWDLAKHWDRAHASGGKGATLINPYKKRDRDQARSLMDLSVPPSSTSLPTKNNDHHSTCSSFSSSSKKHSDDDEQSENSANSDNEEQSKPIKRIKQEDEKNLSLQNFLPPATTANMFFPPPSFFPHHPMFSSFINPSLLLQPKFNYSARPSINSNFDLLKQASAFMQRTKSPNSSRSSSPQQRVNAVTAMAAAAAANGNSNQLRNQQQPARKFEKEERNFQCRWCDYRGRWRSELIQHMRCHHARDKPYHCSACPYASSWKWDVQKHVKKQHVHDTAKIVELPDKYLFQTTLKAKYEGTDDRSLAPAPLTDEDYSYFSADVQQKLSSMKYTRDRTLACQQCPFAANSMAELRRHIIVHSAESPYHCFNCDYKSKWKCDVKKHMRLCNHHGPVLVGRKAMAKVMESLGLVIGNTDGNKSMASDKHNAATLAAVARQMSSYLAQQQQQQQANKTADIDDDDEEIVEDDDEEVERDDDEEDDDENHSLIIVDENHPDEEQKTISHNPRPGNNLRCRQCDYEADDLSDLLLHRKAHASMKEKALANHSDIENEEDGKIQQIHFDQSMFDYELHWLENNPLIKQLATVDQKTRLIVYQCSQCSYTIDNNRPYFLHHLDVEHPEMF